jgi:hypothetical protein
MWQSPRDYRRAIEALLTHVLEGVREPVTSIVEALRRKATASRGDLNKSAPRSNGRSMLFDGLLHIAPAVYCGHGDLAAS